jgi:hypothetical protein
MGRKLAASVTALVIACVLITDPTGHGWANQPQVPLRAETAIQARAADSDAKVSSFPSQQAISPIAFGAKCDGQTDDTQAVRRAIATASNGGIVAFPARRLCNVESLAITNVTGLSLTGAGAKEPSKSSPTPTGIKFTGTPEPCSNGSGGLLRIVGAYNIVIENLGLYEAMPGTPSDCFIDIDRSARVHFVRDFVGDPETGVNTTAFYMQRLAQIDVVQSTVDAGFGRSLYEPASAGNYINLLRLVGDRFSQQPLRYAYNYQVDLAAMPSGNSLGTRAVDISNNAFEVGPNNLRIASGFGIMITSNWVGDGLGIAKWTAHSSVRRNECVTPQNYALVQFVFCTPNAGYTGASEPSWGTIPGRTTNDGDISWINEGPGINFNLTMAGVVTANELGNSSAGNLVLNSFQGSGPLVAGNDFHGAVWWNLKDYASGTTIEANRFRADAVYPALDGLVVVGDGMAEVDSVHIGANHYSNTSRNPTPYIRLHPNSHGVIEYDTSKWTPAKLSNSGGWSIIAPH